MCVVCGADGLFYQCYLAVALQAVNLPLKLKVGFQRVHFVAQIIRRSLNILKM